MQEDGRKLDELDLWIIAELQRDGRMPTSELARRVGASEVTARRRLHRLLDSRRVQVVAAVDPFDVGYETPVAVFLKVDRGKLDEVATQLSVHPRVRFVAATTGAWHLFVEVLAATNEDLGQFLIDELGELEGVREVDSALVLKIYMQRWDWGVRGIDVLAGTPAGRLEPGRARLDRLDLRIIAELQRDGRMPTNELARRVGTSEVTARRRLRRLLDSKTVQVVAAVDPFDVGYKAPAAVFLKVARGKFDAVAEQVARHPRVRFVAALTGGWGLFVEVLAATNQELARFLMDDLEGIEGVLEADGLLMLKIYMQRWAWDVRDVPAEPETTAGGGG